MTGRVMAGAAVVLSLSVCATAQKTRSSDVLGRARHALGGEAALDETRRLRIAGAVTRAVAAFQVRGDVELLVDRPAKFLRRDRLGIAGNVTELVSGFNGTTPIQRATGPDGRRLDPLALVPAGGRGPTLDAATSLLRDEVRLLLLGFLGGPFDNLPARAEHLGTAAAADGQADVVRLTFDAGQTAAFYVDGVTGLPLMVEWQAADVAGVLAAASGPSAAQARPGAVVSPRPVPQVPHRIHFSDYVPGTPLRWPRLVRRSINGQTVEELRIESVLVNPTFDAATFEPDRP